MASTTIEYYYTKQVNGELEIEDLGNCCVVANDDQGLFYIIIVRTSLGTTRIMEYGPSAPDFDTLPKGVNQTFSRLDYNEGKIRSTIDKFLNNPYRQITQAFVMDIQEGFALCKSITDYMMNEEAY